MRTKALYTLQATVFGLALLASVPASAVTASRLFVSPDAFLPNQSAKVISYEIQNNSGVTINQVQIKWPKAGFPITYVSNDQATSFLSTGLVGFGTTDNKLQFKNGTSMTFKITYDIGAFNTTNNPLQNPVIGNDFNGTGLTGQTSILMATLPTIGSPQFFVPLGNDPLTLSNWPSPTSRPTDWILNNAYSNGLKGAGLADPSSIHGLFPAGPVDSLLILPITLLSSIVSADSGSLVSPSFSLFGHSATFLSGDVIYSAMGTAFVTLVTTALSFFVLLVWVTSLYHRLQRATSLDTHADDTWGVL